MLSLDALEKAISPLQPHGVPEYDKGFKECKAAVLINLRHLLEYPELYLSEEATRFEVSLPLCTINGAYSNTKRGKRVKSTAYRKWLDQAGWDFKHLKGQWMREGKSAFTYACNIKLTYEITDSVRKGNTPNPRDLGNHEKLLTDFLVKMGILKDDDLVDEISQRWSSKTTGVIITIEPA